MPPLINQTDQNFWLAYFDAICTVAAFDVKSMKDGAIFFGANALRGPPAGDKVHQDYTNTGLYSIADSLLKPDNLFYLPSASNSYIKSLMTYMGHVDLEGNPSPIQLLTLSTAFENQNIAQTNVDKQLDAAYASFQKQVTLGMISPDIKFNQWAQTNAPAYTTAKNLYDAAAGGYQTQVNTVYGAQSGVYNADMNKIKSAMYATADMPGLTMEACQSSPASAMAIWQAVQKGQSAPEPTGKYLVPYYSSVDYKTIVSDFMGAVDNNAIPTQEAKVEISKGQNIDIHKFGTTVLAGSQTVSWFPWFSVTASASSTETSSTIISESEASNVQISMTYKYIKTADITPGSWNIGDPKNTYKLKKDAPDTVRTLVRPSRLILGCGVGWKITVSDSVKSTIDTQMQSVKSAGGRLNILGISCSIGAGGTTSTQNTTHFAAWDSSGKTLEIKPTFDAGYATILAVVGEKIQTA